MTRESSWTSSSARRTRMVRASQHHVSGETASACSPGTAPAPRRCSPVALCPRTRRSRPARAGRARLCAYPRPAHACALPPSLAGSRRARTTSRSPLPGRRRTAALLPRPFGGARPAALRWPAGAPARDRAPTAG
eukprot:scaffold47526_cov33-Phaeocystis_antarctica.AAC.1